MAERPHRTATERRRAVRIEATLSVRVNERQCVTNNFSLTGLQISLRAGKPLDAGGGEVDITIYLSPQSQVSARGQVMWEVESDVECLVGVDFKSFSGNDGQTWAAFVQKRERGTV